MQPVPELLNPVWHSLRTNLLEFSEGNELAMRLKPGSTPFAAIPEASGKCEKAVRELFQAGERAVFIGAQPESWEGWEFGYTFESVQMLYNGEIPDAEGLEECKRVREEDIPALLELTAIVYPNYFRAGTVSLGPYFAVWRDGKVAAMAGTRLSFPGYRELSTVCTHPDYRGQGLARKLSIRVIQEIMRNGEKPFLHTESDNSSAQKLYQSIGFTETHRLPITVVTRI